MKKTLLIALIALLAASCSCQQRLERLHDRCPDCFTAATAQIIDTVILPGKILTADFSLSELAENAPLIVHQNDVTLTIDEKGDTVKVYVEVPPDTVELTRTVTVPCPQEPQDPQWEVAAAVAVVLIIAIWAIIHELKNKKRKQS